jgi:hypothetical protein
MYNTMNLIESQIKPEVAAEQTKNWRQYYAEGAYLLQDPPGVIPKSEFEQNAFRGFRIPLESLIALKDVIERYNENPNMGQGKIDSVRVYLAKRSPAEKPPSDEDIHIFMTPIVEGGAECPPGQKFGRDLLYFRPVGKEPQPAVFDFSQPCPKQCDTLSILYDNKDQKEPGT